jgi:predicted alpha/beta superfamily hydrolase
MSKSILLILLSLFLIPSTWANTQSVKIVVKAPFNTPESANIFVTGNFQGCSWQPDCLQMQMVDDNLYEVQVQAGNEFKFKVTRGAWHLEGADNSGRALKDQSVSVRDFKINKPIVVDLKNWKDQGPLRVTGRIERIQKFYSPELGNYRRLHIRLPQDYYHSGNTKKYPVIYMHDGQNCFDPQTATFGTDWSVDEVLTRMVRENKVRDAIVVGVFSKNRSSEYNDASLGQLYGKFLVDTVRPFINQKYRTLTGPANTFLMGSSYGSAISVSLAWRYPNIFGRIAGVAFNGAFFNNNLFRLTRTLPMIPTAVYLDHGDYGGDRGYIPHTKRFLKHLDQIGFPKDQLFFKVFSYSGHTEADWARRVHVPLTFLLQ